MKHFASVLEDLIMPMVDHDTRQEIIERIEEFENLKDARVITEEQKVEMDANRRGLLEAKHKIDNAQLLLGTWENEHGGDRVTLRALRMILTGSPEFV